MDKKQIKRDKILIFLWPIIAAVLTIVFKANLFVSTCLFVVVPSIYLSFRKPRYIAKTLLFSSIGVIIFIALDYISVTTGQWFFPYSIIPYRLFGVVAFEGVFWFFFWVYFIVMYYEYFLEEKCTPRLYHPSLKYVFILFLVLLSVFLIVKTLDASLLRIPYFYLMTGIVFGLIPIICVLLRFPNLFTKFAKAAVYFIFFSLIWELVAVPLEQWTFPGQFIGWIDLFGIRFPFEEFFVWIVLGAIAILSWYEFFDDDRK